MNNILQKDTGLSKEKYLKQFMDVAKPKKAVEKYEGHRQILQNM